ncbi:MAG TPA: protein kinase [Terriglobales bacterium]|jgi:WD40 repeat protein
MTGEILGHYRVGESIGSGGMGEVYRATDERLGREVALKLLKPDFVHDRDRLRRFESEARAAAALNHPNIVAIYDFGDHNGNSFIISELLQGSTLRQHLLRGPLPLKLVADYARQIAQGLAAAHKKHIVHRDLKPENIFVTNEGQAKILDFGIAKLIAEETPGAVGGMTTQTKAGSILGTVAYMSPEQLRAKPVDHRSDIFSFGSILYEMLVGKRAFSGETEVDTMTAVLKEDPPEISINREAVPPGFEQIVRHCLEKEPENRFQSSKDLEFALANVSDLRVGKQNGESRSGAHRTRRWIAWGLSALVVVALGMLIGAKMMPAPSPAYHRLTYERGTVYSARFTSDGRSVVYGASWGGRPMQIYFAPAESVLGRPLELSAAHLLALSRSNELALVMGGNHGSGLEFIGGMLARAPLTGGSPRELQSDVRWADWSPKGELAVVHHTIGHSRLEFPIGKVLYETTGWIGNPRFSPDGSKIAFLDHPALYDDRGSVGVIDLQGKKKVLSTGWESEDGLAWDPAGNEIWFTAAEKGYDRKLWSVDLSAKQHKVLEVPGALTLQDIAPDGRVLLSFDTSRLAMEWTDKDGTVSRDLSWYEWSLAKDISSDGEWALFEESSEPAGANYSVAYRKIDGSLPIRLGDGSAGGLSPDGKWAVVVFSGNPEHLTLLPTGAGEPKDIPLPQFVNLQNASAQFLPDGKWIVFDGTEAGHARRSYLVEIETGRIQPITPDGYFATVPSPDGKYLAGGGSDGRLFLYPVAGGDPVPVQGLDPKFSLAQWSADSRGLYVYHSGDMPMSMYRFDLASGKLTEIRQLIPRTSTGVVSIAPVATNPQANAFLYSYLQTMSVLYVIGGLR